MIYFQFLGIWEQTNGKGYLLNFLKQSNLVQLKKYRSICKYERILVDVCIHGIGTT